MGFAHESNDQVFLGIYVQAYPLPLIWDKHRSSEEATERQWSEGAGKIRFEA